VIPAGWRTFRRIVVTIVGTIILFIGVALIFLPGPAFILIPAGIAVLSTEFQWAKKILLRILDKARPKSNRS